ncbi:MAG: chromosomal replication initiator protein DnaA [Clostridia bacterium]|nr:chromosomal replication initiator protein DnaA [Clostridia bacterium]
MDYTSAETRQRIYNSVLEEMRTKCSEASFNWLFKNTVITYMDPTQVDLLTPDTAAAICIKKRYIADLEEAFSKYTFTNVRVSVSSKMQSPKEKKEEKDDDSKYTAYKLRYNPNFTFENFVIGSSNQVAAKASFAIAEHPAELYNPLFIYGPPGLGKTHLLFAIVNHLRDNNPHADILYKTGEEFTQEMVDSLVQKSNVAFREKYRGVDVLLIDDIQFIEGKDKTQEEFFHTIDTLFQQQKQVIITSDRPPKEINLEDRLKSRCEMGLIADIKPPDTELRTAIFKKKSVDMGVDIPDNVLTFLAENIKTNIRQIEGAIKKLKAHSFIEDRQITLDMAVSVLSEYLKTAQTQDNKVQNIFDYICKKYSVKKEVLTSGKRNADIVYARNLCIFALRSLTDMSLKKIGSMFGKDHTTIINSISNVENKMKNEPAYEREVNLMLKELGE